jgi:hypothetical protein
MLVISENLVWRPVVHDRHCTPATADFGHLIQQGSPTGSTSDPAQSLLDGASGRRCDALAGELRRVRQTLGFKGSLMLRAMEIPRFLLGTFYPPLQEARLLVRPIVTTRGSVVRRRFKSRKPIGV